MPTFKRCDEEVNELVHLQINPINMKTAEQEAAFYRDLLEQICQDTRKTRARRLAESGLAFWDIIHRCSASSVNDPLQVTAGKTA